MTDTFNDLNCQKSVFLKLADKLPEADQKTVLKGLQLAEDQHYGQIRHEKIDYVIHPIRIANYLMSEQKISDPDLIVSALLHDTIEDCGMTKEKIQIEFNQHTAELVENLTRPRSSHETEAEKKNNKARSFEKILQSTSEVILLKSLDILDNVRSWKYIKPDFPQFHKFPRWLEEAENYYLPIAKKANPHIYHQLQEEISNLNIIKTSNA